MKMIFKKGEYIVVLMKNDSWNDHIFKQREDDLYLKTELNLSGSKTDGWNLIKADNKINWRYATPNEIAEYNRLGKPFDVTELKTELIPEYVECTFDWDNVTKKGIIYKCRQEQNIFQWYTKNMPGSSVEWNSCNSKWGDTIFKERFKPSTKKAFDTQNKQADLDRIIEEAKIKFPEGTRFYMINKICPDGDKGNIGNIKGNIEWWINGSYKKGEALTSYDGAGLFYYKGKWAEHADTKLTESGKPLKTFKKGEWYRNPLNSNAEYFRIKEATPRKMFSSWYWYTSLIFDAIADKGWNIKEGYYTQANTQMEDAMELITKPQPKKTKNMKQTITRKALIDLRQVSTCSKWRGVIEEYLEKTSFECDDFTLEINEKHLLLLNKEGNLSQKQAVSKLGIVLNNKEVEVDESFIYNSVSVRNLGNYSNKSMYLSSKYDWELKKDDSDCWVLIPTVKSF